MTGDGITFCPHCHHGIQAHVSASTYGPMPCCGSPGRYWDGSELTGPQQNSRDECECMAAYPAAIRALLATAQPMRFEKCGACEPEKGQIRPLSVVWRADGGRYPVCRPHRAAKLRELADRLNDVQARDAS